MNIQTVTEVYSKSTEGIIFFSIVLLGLVRHDYQFLYVDVGKQGRLSDGGVFKNSSLYAAINEGHIKLPSPSPLPGTDEPFWHDAFPNAVPYVIVGDDAFQLSEVRYVQSF